MPRSRQGRKREHQSWNVPLPTSVSSSQSQTEEGKKQNAAFRFENNWQKDQINV